LKVLRNKEVRDAAKEKGVSLWQIAQHLGISEPTMTRWLRTDLSAGKKEVILEAIDQIAKEVV
jgi:transposase